MSNYPKINYIGNKNNLTDWIIENLPYKKGTVLDLFCGGCSVSYALKEKGYKVLANDALYSNYVIAKAIIENKKDILNIAEFENKFVDKKNVEKKYKDISFLENKLYYQEEVKELANLVCLSENIEENQKYMFMALIRRAMIRKIPYSRMNVPWNQIEKLRDEEYSYAKYKRRRAYHNFTFTKHIIDNLNNYNSAVFDNGKENKAYHLDSFEMLKSIDEKIDIVYMDPPYPSTMNKYGDFYGMYDDIFGKKIEYTNLSENNSFLENLEELIKLCVGKTKAVVISENNKTKPTVEELKNMLKKYGKVNVIEKKHQYKVTNKENKNETYEILIILKIKEEL